MSNLKTKNQHCVPFLFLHCNFKKKDDKYTDHIGFIWYCIECDRLTMTVLATPGTALNVTDCDCVGYTWYCFEYDRLIQTMLVTPGGWYI